MDILEFQANPKTERFERNGKGMNITFNADAFTPEFFRNAAMRFRQVLTTAQKGDKSATDAFKKARKEKNALEQTALGLENQARYLESERDIYAVLLAGTPECPVLMEWELTRNIDGVDVPILVSEDEIRKLKPALVKDLYVFCLENSGPKSPETPAPLMPTADRVSVTTSESTEDGSLTPDTPTPKNQIM